MPTKAERAAIFREAARFLRSTENPYHWSAELDYKSATMLEAGHQLDLQADRIEAEDG